MYTISKRFKFSASHALTQLPETHKCHHLHGHNYTVEVALQQEKLNARGFVADYGDMDYIRKFLNDRFDHRHLNDEMPYSPTAENLAMFIYDWARNTLLGPLVAYVRVAETEDTWAQYP